MSWWVLAPLFGVAVIACPAGMWVIGKVTKGKVDCMACFGMAAKNKKPSLTSLEMQKDEVEREIEMIKAGRG